MTKLTEKIRRAWPIRKGCFHCGQPLTTGRQKFTRTCSTCAATAREGFEKMGTGKFKEGMGDVMDTMFGKNLDKKAAAKKAIVQEKMGKALTKSDAKIRKRLKKQGLSNIEIEQGLKEYKHHMGGKHQ